MNALLEYLYLTVLLEYIDLLNRYSGGPSWGPFQAGARGKIPQLPPPVGVPVWELEKVPKNTKFIMVGFKLLESFVDANNSTIKYNIEIFNLEDFL